MNKKLAELTAQRNEFATRLAELKEEKQKTDLLIATLEKDVEDDLADPKAPLIDLPDRYAEQYRLKNGIKQIDGAITKLKERIQNLNGEIANIEGTELRYRQAVGRKAFEAFFPKLKALFTEAYPHYCASEEGNYPGPHGLLAKLVEAGLLLHLPTVDSSKKLSDITPEPPHE